MNDFAKNRQAVREIEERRKQAASQLSIERWRPFIWAAWQRGAAKRTWMLKMARLLREYAYGEPEPRRLQAA